MRTAILGLTAIALALSVVSCADGCSAREAASAAPAAPSKPASESQPGAASQPAQSAPDAGSEASPQSPAPFEPGDAVPPDMLPPAKPEPEPEFVEGMKSASADGPPLGEMHLAAASGKLGPPVDVRYLVSGVVAKNQPVSVQLAFVPRLDGRNLRVEFPDTAGMAIETGAKALTAQKASKSDVVRHTLLVTPTEADAGELRAIVAIDVGEARYAGVVSIPVGRSAQKLASKKVPQG
jgi:multifunctional 2-oxoglutarate metabolism enzyme